MRFIYRKKPEDILALFVARLRDGRIAPPSGWDFLRDASERVRSGPVKYRENIVGGPVNAQAPFLGILQSKNLG
jgi:hypothetical protein